MTKHTITEEQALKLEEALIAQKDYVLGMAQLASRSTTPTFKATTFLHVAQYLTAVAPIWIAVGYEYKLREIADFLPNEYKAQLRFLDSGFQRSGF